MSGEGGVGHGVAMSADSGVVANAARRFQDLDLDEQAGPDYSFFEEEDDGQWQEMEVRPEPCRRPSRSSPKSLSNFEPRALVALPYRAAAPSGSLPHSAAAEGAPGGLQRYDSQAASSSPCKCSSLGMDSRSNARCRAGNPCLRIALLPRMRRLAQRRGEGGHCWR
jgi:hypothetical protein